jgi:cbb3-type cytochrome oxidase maturation protein
MSVIFVVLPMAVILAGLAVWAFIWAARQGQFDDIDTPAYRVAQEDD